MRPNVNATCSKTSRNLGNCEFKLTSPTVILSEAKDLALPPTASRFFAPLRMAIACSTYSNSS